ncbi:hypothetical protein DYD21_02040 [Rhodohalobacter sp. SW132]|uniref:SPOR domain-containing protein n=1 Tax=Rhodohalobacter sp. SW132 TaxID=2293433 RepID=UPI000E2397AE|nr:SPOR domain-containing protein [Rhodohalobacter sp. SW132]REL38754.1 hypothetical protein DYD21_02040 [Rhodohalobacter sp. SW132]
MTINREKLISLLVEKTKMEKADVEAQLDELTQRIMDAANRGKALEIKGLGLFYFDEDGELAFKASDQLNTEINFQYAGMEPVEIKPSKKQNLPPADEPADDENVEDKKPDIEPDPESDDDVFGIGKTLKASETESNDSSEGGPPSDPFGKLFQNPSDEIKPKPEEKLTKTGTTSDKKTTGTNQPKSKPVRKKRDPMVTIIVVIMAVVLLGIGYIAINEYLVAPEPESTVAETEQPVELEEPPVSAEQDLTEPEEPETPDEVETDESTTNLPDQADETQDATDQDRYGLYGEYQEFTGSEFTIVVHSIRNRNTAEQTAGELAQDGYRSNVTERTIDGQVVYRVGIGQFESIQDALNEAETLPEPYRNQNFIQRIQ